MSEILDKLIAEEQKRQNSTIELIASENFVSQDVMKAMGSCLTNKYAEGYPNHRYYGGCWAVDKIEEYCQTCYLELFNCQDEYVVNVQPHSGSQANYAALAAVLKPGDRILSLSLPDGGHLTHGASVNFSGKLYSVGHYNLDRDGFIDVEDLTNKIIDEEPNLILFGASSYPREIHFDMLRTAVTYATNWVNEHKRKWGDRLYNPIIMVDMAHIAGLVAAGFHKSPFGFADIITTTTQKTLRGPHGGLIFCKKKYEKAVNSAVFPGSQGGPLMNMIAAKAVAAEEARTIEFKNYMRSVIYNCDAMAREFKRRGFELTTGGTDNHLLVLDLTRTHPHVTGLEAQETLENYGITVNKNCVPNESRSAKLTSGIRLGTAAMTTKGWTAQEFIKVAEQIVNILDTHEIILAEKEHHNEEKDI